jgi:hypothetical protein
MLLNYKKVIIIVIVFIIVVVGAYFIKTFTNEKSEEKKPPLGNGLEADDDGKVEVCYPSWQSRDFEYKIGRFKVKNVEKDISFDYISNTVYISNAEEDLLEYFKNSKDFVGIMDNRNEYGLLSEDNILLFNNNNYWLVDIGEDVHSASIKSMRTSYNDSDDEYVVVLPCDFDVSIEDYEEYFKKQGYDFVSDFFDTYSFEDLKEFYSRFDESYVKIYDNNKIIRITVKDVDREKLKEDGFTIDCNNKTLTVNFRKPIVYK